MNNDKCCDEYVIYLRLLLIFGTEYNTYNINTIMIKDIAHVALNPLDMDKTVAPMVCICRLPIQSSGQLDDHRQRARPRCEPEHQAGDVIK